MAEEGITKFVDTLMSLDKEERTAILTVIVNQMALLMPEKFNRMKMLIEEMSKKGERMSREELYRRLEGV